MGGEVSGKVLGCGVWLGYCHYLSCSTATHLHPPPTHSYVTYTASQPMSASSQVLPSLPPKKEKEEKTFHLNLLFRKRPPKKTHTLIPPPPHTPPKRVCAQHMPLRDWGSGWAGRRMVGDSVSSCFICNATDM